MKKPLWGAITGSHSGGGRPQPASSLTLSACPTHIVLSHSQNKGTTRATCNPKAILRKILENLGPKLIRPTRGGSQQSPPPT